MVGLLQPNEHRRAVERSWERCLHNRLEANTKCPILRLQQTEIVPRREVLADILRDIRTEIDALTEIALRAGHCLILTDPDCIVIDFRADQSGLAVFDSGGIALGSCWNEQLAGTNGVSLALAQGKIFTARGRDHYFSNLKNFTCTSVPFRSDNGEIIGVLTLSCVDRGHVGDYILAQHLLAQTVERIETRLFIRAHSNHHITPPLPGAPPNALLALDDRSIIVAATHAAAAAAPCACNKIIGRAYEDVYGTVPLALKAPGRFLNTGAVSGRLPSGLQEIAGNDPTAHRAAAKAERLLTLGLPLLVQGEAGTGKHRFAEALLEARSKRVTTLDCAALAARSEISGQFCRWVEQADQEIKNGTCDGVFLCQVDLLPAETRECLLAWLLCHDRNGTLRGSLSRLALIATTNEPHPPPGFEPIFASQQVFLPALKERSDLRDLIRTRYAGLPNATGTITDEAMARLTTYDWPGNLRELDAVLSQAQAASTTDYLGAEHLPEHVGSADNCASETSIGLEEALTQMHWNVSRAARLMGISRATINRRIKEAGLTRPTVRAD